MGVQLFGIADTEIKDFLLLSDGALRGGHLSLGPDTLDLESRTGCLTVNSGTAALDLAMRYVTTVLGRRSIAIPEMTVPMVFRVAERYFGERNIQFVDVSREDLSMLPDEVHTDCVCFPTTGGVPSDRIEADIRTMQKHGVFVIEDASHSHGCVFGTTPTMSLGDIAIQSWYATKVLTMGEGGLFRGDPEAMKWAMCYANQGKTRGSGIYKMRHGENYRVPEVAASLGRMEWLHRHTTFANRRANAEIYLDAGIPYCYPGLNVDKTTFFKYPVYVENRDEVLQALAIRRLPVAGMVHDVRLEKPEASSWVGANAKWINDHQICLPISRRVESHKMAIDVANTLKGVARWAKI